MIGPNPLTPSLMNYRLGTVIKFVPSQCQFTRFSVAGSILSSHRDCRDREMVEAACQCSSLAVAEECSAASRSQAVTVILEVPQPCLQVTVRSASRRRGPLPAGLVPGTASGSHGTVMQCASLSAQAADSSRLRRRPF